MSEQDDALLDTYDPDYDLPDISKTPAAPQPMDNLPIEGGSTDKLAMYAEFLDSSDPVQPTVVEDPIDPADQNTEQAMQPIPGPPMAATMAAAVPKEIVKHFEDPERTRGILNHIGSTWRSWVRPYLQSFARVEEMGLAWGEGMVGVNDPKVLDGIGQDMASFDQLKDMFNKRGMKLRIDQREFTEQLSRKLKSELGVDWRGKLYPGDEDQLVGAAGMAIAVANSTWRADIKGDYEAARWEMMQGEFVKSFPTYKASLHEFTDDVRAMENLNEVWFNGVSMDSLSLNFKATQRLYESMSGKPWEGDWGKAALQFEPVVKALRKARNLSSEALKWQRLGVNIDPSMLVEDQLELPVREVPFVATPLLKYTTARQLGVSYTDQETQGWDNVYSALRDRIGQAPETILGPLFKRANPATPEEQVAANGQPLIGTPGQRTMWEQLDKEIRAETNPAGRFRRLVQGVREIGNTEQKKWFQDNLNSQHAANVIDQRATLVQLQSREPDWRPEDARRIADENLRQRSATADMDRSLAAQMESVPILSAITWAQTAVANVAQLLQADHADDLTAAPIGEAILNAFPYGGLSKMETRYADRAGSLGAYINRSLGTENAYQNWASVYAEKRLLGQTGYWDDAVFAGGAILAGFLEMPGFAADSPTEFLVFARLLGKLHSVRNPLAEGMGRAGVPAPIQALVQLGVDPISPGTAFNTLTGRTPQVVRQLGVGEIYFRRGLRSSNPEYYPLALENAKAMKVTMEREGLIRDATRVDAAMAMYTTLLAEGESGGRITLQSVKDFAAQLAGEDVDITRRMFAPFERQGESYHLEMNRALWMDEITKLNDKETTLEVLVKAQVPEPELLLTNFRSLSQIGTEAYSAYVEGKYNDWVSSFDKGIGRLLGTKVRNEVIALVDRRINMHDTHVHNEPVAWEAAARLGEQQADLIGLQGLIKLGRVRAEGDAVQLRADADVSDLTLRLLKNMQSAYAWNGDAAAAKAMEPAVALFKEQNRVARRAAYNAEELVTLLKIEKEILARKGRTHMTYVNYGELTSESTGLEAGHTTGLAEHQKARISAYLYDLAVFSPQSMGRNNVTLRVHDIANNANLAWRNDTRALINDQRALNLSVIHYATKDLTSARTVLGGAKVTVVQTDASVLKGIERLRKRIAATDAALLPKGRKAFHVALKNAKAYDVQPLDTNLTEVISQVRRKISEFRTLSVGRPIASPVDLAVNPAGSVFRRVMNLKSRVLAPLFGTKPVDLLPTPAMEATSRMMGMIAQQTESNVHGVKILTEQIKDNLHQLSMEDQQYLALVNTLHPSNWPIDLPARIRAIAVQQTVLQAKVINQARTVGEISAQEADRISNMDYEDRFYVTREYRKQLEERGMSLRADTFTEEVRMAESAPLMRFEPAASSRYARVIYRDWAGNHGRWTSREFPVSTHRPAGATNRAAKAWLSDLIARNRVRKGDYREIVNATTPANEAIKGLIDTTGELRADSMAKLYSEVARREFFAQLAQFGGLVRDSLAAIPVKERGNWEHAKGREWGTLDGRFVNKSLIKQMNSWTGFTNVLDSIVKGVQDSLTTAGVDVASLGAVNRGGKKGTLDWMDNAARHNYMMGNIASWMNNNMGNITGNHLGGARVYSVDYWHAFNDYTRLYENYAQTESLAATHRSLGRETVETRFIDAGTYGFYQRAADVPGGRDSTSHGFRNVLEIARKRDEIEFSRLVQQMTSWHQSAQRASNQLMLGTNLSTRVKTRLVDSFEMFSRMYNEARSEVIAKATRFGIVHELNSAGSLAFQKGRGFTLGTEAYNAALRADRSSVRALLSSRYSQIDSKHKWAFFSDLIAQGMSKDTAFERVARFTQNFGGVAPWIRSLKDKRITGAFVPGFPAEAARNLYNSVRENPGRIINTLAAVAAYNAATLFSKGMLPTDVFKMAGDDSTIDFMKRMFFTIMVRTPTGVVSLDASQWMSLAPFMQPSGGGKPVVAGVNKFLDNKFGAYSLPVQMVLNFATNFVINTPVTGLLEKHTMGIDAFRGEITYNKGTWGELLSSFGADALGFVAPATFVRGFESYSEYNRGPVSMLTKYNRSALSRTVSGLGVNTRELTRTASHARIIVDNAGPQISAEIYVDAMGSDARAYKAAVFRLSTSLTNSAEYKAAFKEAVERKKELTSDVRSFGGIKVDYSPPESVVRERVLADAGANINQVIERLPANRAVATLQQLLGGNAKTTDSEVRHLVRVLTDPVYLHDKTEVESLMDGMSHAYTLAIQSIDPAKKQVFAAVASGLIAQLRVVKDNAVTRKPVDLMKMKLGALPGYLQKLTAQRLGL